MSEISKEFVGPSPRLAVDRVGNGPLVIFLHGVGGNRTNWRHELETLCDRFCCAAVDARGYNESEPYEGAPTLADYVGDIERVRLHFGAERFHLVGLSMGGMLAQEYYHRHPDRVASLVLADTFSGFEQPGLSEKMKEQRRKPFEDGKTMADVAAESARMLVGPNASRDLVKTLTDCAAELDRDAYLHAADAMADFRRTADLGRIAVPALVLTGEFDRPAAPERVRAMAEAIPNADFHVIKDAGHVSNLEQPERFGKALSEFLDAHRERASQPKAA